MTNIKASIYQSIAEFCCFLPITSVTYIAKLLQFRTKINQKSAT